MDVTRNEAAPASVATIVLPETIHIALSIASASIPQVSQARQQLMHCYRVNHNNMYSACSQLERYYSEVFQSSVQRLATGATERPECASFIKPIIACAVADRIDCASYVKPFLDCVDSTRP